MFAGLKAFWRRHSRRITVAEKAQSQIEDDMRDLYAVDMRIENEMACKALIEKRIKRLKTLIEKHNEDESQTS